MSDLVHFIKVSSGFTFTLTTGQEHDTGDCWGNSSGQSSDGSLSDFLSADLSFVGVRSTGGNHVGLQEGTFKINVVVAQGLIDSSEDSFSDLLAGGYVVGTVVEDFGLNNGDQTVSLADSSVSGKAPSVFLDSLFTWAAFVDLEDSSPLSESAADVVEFLGSLGEVIEAEGGSFFLGAWEDSSSLINLKTRMSKKLILLSTLIPGMTFLSFKMSMNFLPSLVACLVVSSKRMTPEMYCSKLGVVKRSSLYCLLCSSLFSSLMASNLLPMVPVDSSAARIP